MIYKKILIVFLLFFTIFGFSTVFGADIPTTNVSSDLHYYVEKDQRKFLNVLHKNNIYNLTDFYNFVNNLGISASGQSYIYYYCIYPIGYHYDSASNSLASLAFASNRTFYVYFSTSYDFPENNSGSGYWYNVQTNFKTVSCSGYLTFSYGKSRLTFHTNDVPSKFVVPDCWQWYTMEELFNSDLITSSINDVNETLTEDSSSQSAIDLSTHNNEMNTASDSIKNSNLYNKFSNLSNNLQEAFTYNNDDVTTLPISFNKKNVVLKSNEISKFFKNNNLSFVITLWQSILWFSLLYTMFLFIRKIYKSVVGGNPVDDVQKTLSNEDNKIVGGF